MNAWGISLGNLGGNSLPAQARCRNVRLEHADNQKQRAYSRISLVMRPHMPYSTAEIAELVGRGIASTRSRLEELMAQGKVDKIVEEYYGGRGRFLWVKR